MSSSRLLSMRSSHAYARCCVGFAKHPKTAATVTIGDLRLDRDAHRVWLAGEELDLTRKEFELLARLIRNAGKVVSRETLMSDVWDTNWFGSTKTLDVHIAGLRRKLGDPPEEGRYIQTVRGVGFRFGAGGEPDS